MVRNRELSGHICPSPPPSRSRAERRLHFYTHVSIHHFRHQTIPGREQGHDARGHRDKVHDDASVNFYVVRLCDAKNDRNEGGQDTLHGAADRAVAF